MDAQHGWVKRDVWAWRWRGLPQRLHLRRASGLRRTRAARIGQRRSQARDSIAP